ncbi:Fic family protein [Phascolarctobacterium sp.]
MLSIKEREKAEGKAVAYRLYQLHLEPLTGNWDLDHLKAINAYLFQDLPKLGPEWAEEYKPGCFRPEVPSDQFWRKNRILKNSPEISTVVYSNMTPAELQVAGDFLRQAVDLPKLKSMTTEAFTAAISSIYITLDQLHPFPDGNSRTIREFTRSLAKEAGYEIHWERFTKTKDDYDRLYLARDLSVNAIAIKRLPSSWIKLTLMDAAKKFAAFKPLPEVMKEIVKPIQWTKEQTCAVVCKFIRAGKDPNMIIAKLANNPRVPGEGKLTRTIYLSKMMNTPVMRKYIRDQQRDHCR